MEELVGLIFEGCDLNYKKQQQPLSKQGLQSLAHLVNDYGLDE